MWIYGYAGCGKSAIAQVVSETMANEGRLAASFFFFRGSSDRDSIIRFATTIANQLSATVPATAPIIRATIETTPGLLSATTATLSAQFQHLVYDSFAKSMGKRNLVSASFGLKSFLIVLDGIDECKEKEQIAAFIEDMIEFFNNNPRVPLRFLITSRVENHLYQCLHSSGQVKVLNLVENTSDADISSALDIAITKEKRRLEFACEPSWPCEEDKDRLVKHIGGSYILMTTLIKLLFDQSSENELSPMQRLPRLLSMRPDFDSLYKETLETSLKLPHFHDIIGVVAVAQEPLSIAQIAELLGIETFPVSRVLVNLHAIMQVPGDDRSPVTLWHTSLRDFLCSKGRAGPYFAGPLFHLHFAFGCTAFSNRTPPSPANPFWQRYTSRYAELHLRSFTQAPSGDDALDFNGALHSTLQEVKTGRFEDPLVWKVRVLRHGAIHGRDDIVRFLLERGADPNAKDSYGGNPLHNASRHGHTKVVQHLLEFGADPNMRGRSRRTPLHWACSEGHVEAAALLLDHNADPTIRDNSGFTPCQSAHHGGSLQVTAMLLKRGIME